MTVETYTIEGYPEKETGLLIAENDQWILVKHIPVDYVIDGYRLYKKKYIEKRKSKAKQEKIARVLRLKNITIEKPTNFNFGNELDILKWSEKTYGLFEFQDHESELFYGKLNATEDHRFIIDMIKVNGKIEPDYDYEFITEEIQIIGFESDYFESVRLLMNDELKGAPQLKKV
ncbi:hypothetical protein [Aquimarina sp. 2201CG14-23]|uniref:hypothetical protein n=1 Tax=Aquimarina mycalae TaxID=3040073 RepID=UPI00247807CB|nr:hypothetical protein [Aquimarina sp. 2201CG14-23]MDH7444546.1 hypothetical protein [Aquimarina sp. 2201CG14-23]